MLLRFYVRLRIFFFRLVDNDKLPAIIVLISEKVSIAEVLEK